MSRQGLQHPIKSAGYLSLMLLVVMPLSPMAAAGEDSNTSLVPLFPSASDMFRQGFVRVINRSGEAGEIRIAATDDAGIRIDSAVLAMGANETAHFNSDDLEDGNGHKGLSGGTGPGQGDWRLQLSTALDIEVLAYIRTEDGLLTAMHDVVQRGAHGHRLAIFNPAKNRNQQSLLRLINDGETATEVSISGIDDLGMPGTGKVMLTLRGGGARTVSARELESATSRNDPPNPSADEPVLAGELGAGSGKWQLLVKADAPIAVMSLLTSPTGHLTNLSTAPLAGADRGGHGGTATPPPATSNNLPAFDEGAEATRELAENTPADIDIGQPLRATDPEGGDLSYSLEGADAANFYVVRTTGQLRTRDGVEYNFEAKSSYSLVVRADDDEGGSATIAVTVELLDEDGEAPGRPPVPLLTGAAMTSLSISWSPPANPGPEITGYDVGYRVLNAGAFADWPHDGTQTAATIENLDHSTPYQLIVVAHNDEGTGPISRRLLAATRTPHTTEPALVADSSHAEEQGFEGGVPVTLVDRIFGADGHGARITRTYMDTVADADRARHTQTDGGRDYRLEGMLLLGYSDFLATGYIGHALDHGDGIVWSASDQSTPYRPGDFDWFVENGRPFTKTARAFANWMQNRNVLLVSSIENATARRVGSAFEPVYCDEFLPGGFDGLGWIPLCGNLDDYIAHSGTGQDNTVFAGGIDDEVAVGAIQGDGVFAPHTIHVESPDGSTSHATAVLAAYATEMKFANPTWSAAKLRQELIRVAREQEYDYFTGRSNEFGTGSILEKRIIRVILPAFAPGTGNRFPQFSSTAAQSAPENQTAAGSVMATDPDPNDAVTGYAVVGGADAAQFQISGVGALRFKTAPDFEMPADADGPEPDSKAGDNDYMVVVQATSGTGNRMLTAQQRITVTVTDETE